MEKCGIFQLFFDFWEKWKSFSLDLGCGKLQDVAGVVGEVVITQLCVNYCLSGTFGQFGTNANLASVSGPLLDKAGMTFSFSAPEVEGFQQIQTNFCSSRRGKKCLRLVTSACFSCD